MSRKTIVTMRSVLDGNHYFIKCDNPYNALKVAGKLHNIELKEHTYIQIRLRSSFPSKKLYKMLKIEDIITVNNAI